MNIQQKIQRARTIFEEHGERLRNEPTVARLMAELESHWRRSWRLMEETGIVAACKRCEEEDGGSCCGRGIENRYSAVLLLLNLLCDVALPDRPLFEDSCHFLGDCGCRLKIRDVLCVNYLCTTVQKSISRGDLLRVQQTVGSELDTVFVLQERVKSLLKPPRGPAVL